MKHRSCGRRGDGDERGGWSRGVRAGGGPTALDARPCTSLAEVHARFQSAVWSRSHRRGIAESEADDIFQSVFVRLEERIRTLGMPDPVEPVLDLLIDNEVRSAARARGRQGYLGEVDGDELPSSKPDPEQALDLAEERAAQQRIVAAAVARLTNDEVQILSLALVAGMSQRDMGEVLGRPEGTVSVQIHRARARFRQLAESLRRLDEASRGQPRALRASRRI
jgi:RNA polymerase sigma-70 factor (ECF subfamily)